MAEIQQTPVAYDSKIEGNVIFTKVDSAIIRIALNAEKCARLEDWTTFNRFVRSLFLHRRKFLRSCLKSALKGQLDKSDIDQLMNRLQLGPTCRAEELEISQLHRLYLAANQMIKG